MAPSIRYRLATGVFLAGCVSFSSAVPSRAESYENLHSQGYKTSQITKNRAGLTGWKVSKGDKLFFCKLRGGLVYVGKTGMAAITSSGRHISMDRKVYEATTGGPDLSMPHWEDLKAGRVDPGYPGPCTPFR